MTNKQRTLGFLKTFWWTQISLQSSYVLIYYYFKDKPKMATSYFNTINSNIIPSLSLFFLILYAAIYSFDIVVKYMKNKLEKNTLSEDETCSVYKTAYIFRLGSTSMLSVLGFILSYALNDVFFILVFTGISLFLYNVHYPILEDINL